MSIENYGQLKTAVANWLATSELTSRIPEFISLAEDRIARDIRVRPLEQETSTDVTISSQTVTFAAASISSWLGARRFYLSSETKPRLEYIPSEAFWEMTAAWETGTPKFFTIEGTNIHFAPAPDTTYTGKLLYWKRWTAFSADGDENWLLTNHAGLYLYGALIEASPYLDEDERTFTWANMYDEAAKSLEIAVREAKYPAGDLRVKSDVGIL